MGDVDRSLSAHSGKPLRRRPVGSREVMCDRHDVDREACGCLPVEF